MFLEDHPLETTYRFLVARLRPRFTFVNSDAYAPARDMPGAVYVQFEFYCVSPSGESQLRECLFRADDRKIITRGMPLASTPVRLVWPTDRRYHVFDVEFPKMKTLIDSD